MPAFLTVDVPGGKVRMYTRGDEPQMIAFCSLHGALCRRQRSLVHGRRAAQGRPLGYLLELLANGSICANQVEHNGSAVYTYGARSARRQQFRTDAYLHGVNPTMQMLLASDRVQRVDEPDAPLQQP